VTLRVVTPREVVIDERVTRVTVRAEDGSRTFLPRHIDFVTALAPSVISYRRPEAAEHPQGEERFVAVDEGVLTKAGDELLVSAPYAIVGERLGELQRLAEEQFREREDRERVAHTALARLEANIIRRFMELGDRDGA